MSSSGGGQLSATQLGYIDRLALLAAGGGGQLTTTRVTNLDALGSTAALLIGTAQKATCYPNLANGASNTTPAGAWTYSGWSQVVAATGAAGAVIAIVCVPGATTQWQIQLGTGAGGAEVAGPEVALLDASIVGPGFIIPVGRDGWAVPNGTRIVVRAANSNGAGGDAMTTKVNHLPSPF